jgi:hypothetical protein
LSGKCVIAIIAAGARINAGHLFRRIIPCACTLFFGGSLLRNHSLALDCFLTCRFICFNAFLPTVVFSAAAFIGKSRTFLETALIFGGGGGVLGLNTLNDVGLLTENTTQYSFIVVFCFCWWWLGTPRIDLNNKSLLERTIARSAIASHLSKHNE